MARTNEFTEVLVDWVSGRLRQNRFSNLWLGGGPGADGGSSYRPIDGQLTQRHVCYDTSEDASPCSPSGFSSLVDNLRRIRYWQEPATWFGAETTSGLKITIKPGLWYPSTTEYCAFAGGDSPTFTLPSGVLDKIDTVYIDASGILHIQHGTPAVSPTITLPPIASGIPLWAVYLPPTASGVYFQVCSGYYAGQAYIERDLRPFLNLGGGGAVASGIPTSNRGAILRGGVADWETYNVGAANEVLTNDGTDVIWSTGAINLTAGKTLVVSVNLTLAGVDGKSLTIEENSILNQDLTTDASVTFADVFVTDGGTFGISGNELLTVNAAGNFTFSGVTSIVVPDGAWVGADANCAWLFDSSNGDITTQDNVGIGTITPEGQLDVAYGGYIGKMTLLLGAQFNANARPDNTNKRTIVGSYHRINAEEPVAMMYVFSGSALNRLDIGGGWAYCNAATQVSIYTAANTTTTTGTERLKVDSTGAITVTGPSLTVPAAWNLIVPDNVADALGLDDIGGIEYLKIITTNAQPITRFNDGGVDVDFEVEAVGVADALQIRGSDGQVTLGVLTAGFVKSSAGGVLSVVAEVALADLAGYAQGSIIRGGAADWEALAHPGAAGYALVSDATDVVWDQTPLWSGVHTHAANVVLDDGVGDSPQLQFIGGSNNDTVLMYLDDDAVANDSDLVIRLCAADTGSQLIIQDNSPAAVVYIDADGNADFEGHVAIGNNASVDTNLVLLVDESLTAVAGVWSAGRFFAEAAHAAPSAVKLYAVRAVASQGSASAMTASNALVGFYGGVNINGTGLVKKGRGLWSIIGTANAAGAMTTGIGVESGLYGTAGTALTLTDLYHYYAKTSAGAATFTVTNHYGLYIQDVALGSVLNYSIYTNVGLVHFGDQVEIIGSAAADIQLIVKGAAAQSASLVQYQDSAAAIFFDSGDGLANSETVWNEQGLDIDFRVEGVGQANALFVQGSDGNIGIGTAAPTHDIDLYRANSNAIIRAVQTGAGNFFAGFMADSDDAQINLAAYDDAYADVAEYAGKCVFQAGNANLALAAFHATGEIQMYTGGRAAANKHMIISAAGAMQWPAYGAGTLTTDATGNITAVSDARLKEQVRNTEIGLAEVLQMQGKAWHYTEESGLDTEYEYLGFIADDIEKIVPQAVGRMGDGMRTLNTNSLLPAFAKAIQELNAKLTLLEIN